MKLYLGKLCSFRKHAYIKDIWYPQVVGFLCEICGAIKIIIKKPIKDFEVYCRKSKEKENIQDCWILNEKNKIESPTFKQ